MPADYLLGDAEGEEEELYLLDPEHAHREWRLGNPGKGSMRGLGVPGVQTMPACSRGARVCAAPGGLPVAS